MALCFERMAGGCCDVVWMCFGPQYRTKTKLVGQGVDIQKIFEK